MPAEKAEQVSDSSLYDMAIRMTKLRNLDGKYLTLSEFVANTFKYKDDISESLQNGVTDMPEEAKRKRKCV